MAIFLINNGSSPQGKGIFPDRRGELPFDLIRDKHVRDALTNAEMEFSAAGGLTGLRLRRKEAEAVQVCLSSEGYGYYSILVVAYFMLSGALDSSDLLLLYPIMH